MDTMERCIVLFQSTHAVIKAEQRCIDAQIPCRVVPVPRRLSSECGIAIECTVEQLPAVTALLTKYTIPFTLHRIP